MNALYLELDEAIENNNVHSFLMDTDHTLEELANAYKAINFDTMYIRFTAFKWSQVQLFGSSIAVRIKLHRAGSINGSVSYDYENLNFTSIEDYKAALPGLEERVTKRNYVTSWLGTTAADSSMNIPGLSIAPVKKYPGTIVFVVRKMVEGAYRNKSFTCCPNTNPAYTYKLAIDHYKSLSPFDDMPAEWLVIPRDRINAALCSSYES